jgi:hypothetical protein
MRQPELFERSPEARTVVEPSESATDALVRAAKRTDVDPLSRETRVQDVVDGDALDQLFGDARPRTVERETRPRPLGPRVRDHAPRGRSLSVTVSVLTVTVADRSVRRIGAPGPAQV